MVCQSGEISPNLVTLVHLNRYFKVVQSFLVELDIQKELQTNVPKYLPKSEHGGGHGIWTRGRRNGGFNDPLDYLGTVIWASYVKA